MPRPKLPEVVNPLVEIEELYCYGRSPLFRSLRPGVLSITTPWASNLPKDGFRDFAGNAKRYKADCDSLPLNAKGNGLHGLPHSATTFLPLNEDFRFWVKEVQRKNREGAASSTRTTREVNNRRFSGNTARENASTTNLKVEADIIKRSPPSHRYSLTQRSRQCSPEVVISFEGTLLTHFDSESLIVLGASPSSPWPRRAGSDKGALCALATLSWVYPHRLLQLTSTTRNSKMASANPNSANGASKTDLYMREAKMPEEFDGVLNCAVKAFNIDPCFMYFGTVKELTATGLKPENEKGLTAFMTFIIKTCIDMKAVFTVVVDPAAEGGKEKIVAAIYWVPPNERIALYQISRLLRGGIWGVLSNWGLGCVDRITTQYLDKCHHAFHVAFKRRGLKRSVDDTWYLNLAATDPAYQGRGCMSMLVREFYRLHPEEIITIEATTTKVKDQYAHLGFEDLQEEFYLGKGKIGTDGLPKEGAEATGTPVYPMIKRLPASSRPDATYISGERLSSQIPVLDLLLSFSPILVYLSHPQSASVSGVRRRQYDDRSSFLSQPKSLLLSPTASTNHTAERAYQSGMAQYLVQSSTLSVTRKEGSLLPVSRPTQSQVLRKWKRLTMARPPLTTRVSTLEKRVGLEQEQGSSETALLLDDTQSPSYSSHPHRRSLKYDSLDAHYSEDLVYTPEEEAEVVKILDRRLFPFILLTTFVLNMDRTNISNAISDGLASDLGFGMDVINGATAIYAVVFAGFCMTGAVLAKLVGPSRWIPILMFSWGIVTLAHALIKDKFGYITVRCCTSCSCSLLLPLS
ncbi:hypothetical protein NMY22_g8656 [Coprinellus aureogranulatus]|nr:hypothetical protein NMY22_g8656 [Coprinellus aureogranulatus]